MHTVNTFYKRHIIPKSPASLTPLLSKHQHSALIPNAELGQMEAGHREAIEPELRTKERILRVHFLHNWLVMRALK
jgi:hypothetical protein